MQKYNNDKKCVIQVPVLSLTTVDNLLSQMERFTGKGRRPRVVSENQRWNEEQEVRATKNKN